MKEELKKQLKEFINDARESPGNAACHYNLAHAYSDVFTETGDFRKYHYAMQHYKRAVALRPAFYEAFTNIGVLIVNTYSARSYRDDLDYVNEGIAYLEKATGIGKEGVEGAYSWMHLGFAYFFKGLITGDGNDFFSAIVAFKKVSAFNYGTSAYFEHYGACLVQLGLTEKEPIFFIEAMEKYLQTIDFGRSKEQVYCDYFEDGFVMLKIGYPHVFKVIEQLVKVTTLALDEDIEFTQVQKDKLRRHYTKLFEYGFKIESQTAGANSFELIPFHVLNHNMKELLSDN